MPAVVLYFHVHQPLRVKKYSLFDIGQDNDYFSGKTQDLDNRAVFNKVAQKCYLPANELMLNLLKKHPEFKLSFSLSGLFLEQALEFNPQVIDSFKALVDTGRVELLAETYYHSLSFVSSKKEFQQQVKLHQKIIKDIFNYKPTSFRNTELIYNNDLAQTVSKLGFKSILAEGVDRNLSWRSPNHLYRTATDKSISLLLKNYRLSDDIAFRFSDSTWPSYPLTPDKFADWVMNPSPNAEIVNLFMDYETLGEHQWVDTGIFEFFKDLPSAILSYSNADFMTVSQAAKAFTPKDVVNIPEFTSWADSERDLSAWLDNPFQQTAFKSLNALEADVINSGDQALINDWRRLTTSDHYYYMSTKKQDDGKVHQYFSPHKDPLDAYTHFMNVIHDLRIRLTKPQPLTKTQSQKLVVSSR